MAIEIVGRNDAHRQIPETIRQAFRVHKERKGVDRWKIKRIGILCVTWLIGCVSPDYAEMYDLPSTGWQRSQSIVFTFSPIGVDSSRGGTPADRWVDITVRHRADFSYAELPLEIKAVTPDKQFWIDTVYVPLGGRNDSGDWQWYGRHYSNHYDISQRYRSRIRYTASGEYALSIRQVSDVDTLNGILSLGVTVSQAEVSPRPD